MQLGSEQRQLDVLIVEEAVGCTDHTSPNQQVAQHLFGKCRRVVQNPAGENLPGAKDQQHQHNDGHDRAHSKIEPFFQFFQGFFLLFESFSYGITAARMQRQQLCGKGCNDTGPQMQDKTIRPGMPGSSRTVPRLPALPWPDGRRWAGRPPGTEPENRGDRR